MNATTNHDIILVPNSIIDDTSLTLYDRAVYIDVLAHGWATADVIADRVGCSVAKVQRSLAVLQSRELTVVDVKQEGF